MIPSVGDFNCCKHIVPCERSIALACLFLIIDFYMEPPEKSGAPKEEAGVKESGKQRNG